MIGMPNQTPPARPNRRRSLDEANDGQPPTNERAPPRPRRSLREITPSRFTSGILPSMPSLEDRIRPRGGNNSGAAARAQPHGGRRAAGSATATRRESAAERRNRLWADLDLAAEELTEARENYQRARDRCSRCNGEEEMVLREGGNGSRCECFVESAMMRDVAHAIVRDRRLVLLDRPVDCLCDLKKLPRGGARSPHHRRARKYCEVVSGRDGNRPVGDIVPQPPRRHAQLRRGCWVPASRAVRSNRCQREIRRAHARPRAPARAGGAPSRPRRARARRERRCGARTQAREQPSPS